MQLTQGLSPKPQQIAACGCGRTYTQTQWSELRYVGIQPDEDDYPDLELRDCVCGSTLAADLPGYTVVARKHGSKPMRLERPNRIRAERTASLCRECGYIEVRVDGPRVCGHSVCSQHYIDTGSIACVRVAS